MQKKVILALAVPIVLVAGILLYYGLIQRPLSPQTPPTVEHLGGKYNVTLVGRHTVNVEGRSVEVAEIRYVDAAGNHSGLFQSSMNDSLVWIRENTPQGSVFLCWWDYGHMIKGYAERDVVIKNPSRKILASVANQTGVVEFEPDEKVFDVAVALTTTDPNETVRIMEEYGASYILVCKDDLKKAYWIFKAAELNPEEYLDQTGFTEKGRGTMIARLLDNRDTSFSLVHHDEEVNIYRIP